MENFHWTCKSCTKTFFSLENISTSLEEIKGKYEFRMTNLEEKVENIEKITKQEVALRVSNK